MRFILIDPSHRRPFDVQAFGPITEELICHRLRCDYASFVEIGPDLGLWVSEEWKPGGFRLFEASEFAGAGILTGITKLGEIKSLPRRISREAVSNWLTWPVPAAEIRLRQNERTAAVSTHGRPLLHVDRRAIEIPHIMQMYA